MPSKVAEPLLESSGGQEVQSAVEDLVESRRLGEVGVPGFVKPVLAFTVERLRSGAPDAPTQTAPGTRCVITYFRI